MSKEMIISSSAHETRVAILEDDQVAEIFIERERSRGVVGNVYKGRVSKVLPGMQSAFVDLGLERDGFLYVTDVVAALEELDRFETEEEDVPAASLGRRLATADRPDSDAIARRVMADAAIASVKRVPSPRSKSSSKKARRSSSRWRRSRLGRKAPA